MIAVGAGGPRIQAVNSEYTAHRLRIGQELLLRNISDPNPFGDLWAWYGKWSSGDLPRYADRRRFVCEIYQPIIDRLGSTRTGVATSYQPTGWERVDRVIADARDRLAVAEVEEQFQGIGLLCREAMITLAQTVYQPDRHPSPDGVTPSSTDAKRMLDAFYAFELRGAGNEPIRKHARAALDAAVALQHDRTAIFRDAAMCLEATASVVAIVAVASGRRDGAR